MWVMEKEGISFSKSLRGLMKFVIECPFFNAMCHVCSDVVVLNSSEIVIDP